LLDVLPEADKPFDEADELFDLDELQPAPTNAMQSAATTVTKHRRRIILAS
jgi:hypothetical protein